MNRHVAISTLILSSVISGCGTAQAPSMSVSGSPASTPASVVEPGDTKPQPTYTWPTDLNPGTYDTTFIWDTPVTVTFTVPAGWVSRDVEIIKDPVSRTNEVGGPRGLSVIFSLVDNVYADPCGAVLSDPPIGASIDELAEALVRVPGTDAAKPVTATFAGHSGKYVELSIRDDRGCDMHEFHMFSTRPEWMLPSEHRGPPFWTAERTNYRLWILDVDGVRYVVGALSADDATAADLAELQGVVEFDQIADRACHHQAERLLGIRSRSGRWQPLPCLDADRQPVLGRSERA